MSPIRVIIVDDHEVVRMGLQALINGQSDMVCAGEASSFDDAIVLVDSERPTVAVVDVRLPDRSGIDVCREITSSFPRTSVVMLTSYPNDALIVQALEAGASGYVLKSVGNRELLRAIRAAAANEMALDPVVASKLVARMRDLEREVRSGPLAKLKPRELEVLTLVARGLSNRDIGGKLFLGETTVRNYVSSLLDRFGLHNRIELAVFAVDHGIRDDKAP